MRYTDYHRTLIGYHGTRVSLARQIVQRLRDFDASRNPDDWLGHGVYFWEHAPQQAFRWARRRQRSQNWGEDVAVLGSMIRLGNCLDLLDPFNVRHLEGMHAEYAAAEAVAGRRPPRNFNSRKFLDCAVFEYAYATFAAATGVGIDSCRAVYVPSGGRGRAWPGSWISREAHIQLCVRNPACIMGTWLVSPDAAPEDDV